MADNRRAIAWAAGQKAALDGKPASVCRRRPGTIFYDDWHDGHEDGLRARAEMETQRA